jgi:hypothetical protein
MRFAETSLGEIGLEPIGEDTDLQFTNVFFGEDRVGAVYQELEHSTEYPFCAIPDIGAPWQVCRSRSSADGVVVAGEFKTALLAAIALIRTLQTEGSI